MKLANLFLVFMICMISLEAFSSSASRRRSRKAYQYCLSQVSSIPTPEINCSSVNRTTYIQNYLSGYNFDHCSHNRHLRDDSLLTVAAQQHVIEQATLAQCFGTNFTKVTLEEALWIEKVRKEQEEKATILKYILISIFLAAIVGLIVIARND